MRHGKRIGWLVCLWLAGACSRDSEVDALVREVRADRLQRQSAANESARHAPEANATRAVLKGLADAQRQLAEDQLNLAKELRQWTQLVAANAGERQAAESSALQARLEELEVRLEEQRARHTATEALIGRTLNQTAAQLEAFLQRMQSTDGGAGSGPTAEPEKEAGAAPASTPPPAGAPHRGRDERQASLWPMWTAAGMAIVAGVWLLRQPAGTNPRMPAAASSAQAHPRQSTKDAEGGNQDLRELLDTAALLGEAIGKIKANASDVARPGTPLEPSSPAAPVIAGGSAPGEPGAPATGQVAVFVVATDQARARGAVMAALGQDPRVLTEPGPRVDARDGGLEVTFRVVPGLSGGERAAIEQRVYEAAR